MSSLPTVDRIPSVEEVARVAALTDAVIRNLQITQSYHELAVAMTARTGISANWCTFATWASRQAGQTIRKEDFARTLEHILQAAPVALEVMPDVTASAQKLGSDCSPAEIQESVLDVLNPLAALDRASDAVARGNKKVYEEIGREFARFFATCLNDPIPDPDKLTAFCAGLRSGDPPEGQDCLRQAFTSYYHALFETDAKTAAELMLYANLQIGYHEQTRLQPEIAEAMDAALVDYATFRTRLIKAIFPYRGWLARLRLYFLWLFSRPSPFDAAIEALVAEARRRAHLLITEYMMTITLPGGVLLNLGEDVPAEFPPVLAHVVLPDLSVLLEKLDNTPNNPHGSGAVDWAQLPDRLHFISDMFRCYHQSADLFDPPFTDEQVTAFRNGRLPDSRL